MVLGGVGWCWMELDGVGWQSKQALNSALLEDNRFAS